MTKHNVEDGKLVGRYTSPKDVLKDDKLTKDAKIEILRRWSYNVAEMNVAEEEGMVGDDGDGDLQHRIMLALDELTGGLDLKHSPSTKQHGLVRASVKRNQ